MTNSLDSILTAGTVLSEATLFTQTVVSHVFPSANLTRAFHGYKFETETH